MGNFLASNRLRSLILNVPLFVLFVCAWISDRWPDLMVPALAVAFGAIIVEVIALILMSQKPDDRSCLNETQQTAVARSEPVAEPEMVSSELVESWSAEMAILSQIAARHEARNTGLMMISHSMGAYIATRHAYLIRKRSAVRSGAYLASVVELRAQRATSQLPTLPDWKIVPQGQEAFTIDAGAFEIEHFGGRTNIRIHDADRVTVESSKRGSVVAGLPADIKPAQYN